MEGYASIIDTEEIFRRIIEVLADHDPEGEEHYYLYNYLIHILNKQTQEECINDPFYWVFIG